MMDSKTESEICKLPDRLTPEWPNMTNNFAEDWRPSSDIPMQIPLQEDVECLLAIEHGLTRNRQLHNMNVELKLDSA